MVVNVGVLFKIVLEEEGDDFVLIFGVVGLFDQVVRIQGVWIFGYVFKIEGDVFFFVGINNVCQYCFCMIVVFEFLLYIGFVFYVVWWNCWVELIGLLYNIYFVSVEFF